MAAARRETAVGLLKTRGRQSSQEFGESPDSVGVRIGPEITLRALVTGVVAALYGRFRPAISVRLKESVVLLNFSRVGVEKFGNTLEKGLEKRGGVA